MRWLNWKALVVGASVCGLACGASLAVAQDAEEEGRIGKIVRIGKDLIGEDEEEVVVIEEDLAQAEGELTFWIGMSGRGVENPVLRTHLQLAEDMGVVVETVVEGSPAAEAGLRRHDILLRANGEAVHNMRVLRDIVSKGGGRPIELELIRLGKKITLEVTPAERPANASAFSGRGRGRMVFGDDEREAIRKMLEQFGQPGAIDRWADLGAGRAFRPGMVFPGQANDLTAMPNGVSVTLQKQGEKPTRAIVRQGDRTWTVEAGDDEAIEKLPEDLRPHVRQMLENAEGRFGAMRFDFDMSDFDMGDFMRDFDMSDFQVPPWQPKVRGQFDRGEEDEVLQRMEAIERRLEELQQRLGEEQDR